MGTVWTEFSPQPFPHETLSCALGLVGRRLRVRGVILSLRTPLLH